jgi:V8-like Glu-specific endopeptidase
MPVLDRDLKNRLIDTLAEVPSTERPAGRSALLDGVPRNITNPFDRDDNKINDLSHLVRQLDQIGRLDNGERPVVIFVNNAWRQTRGSELGRTLSALQDEIEKKYAVEPPLEGLPDTPEVLIFGGEGEWVENTFMEKAQEAGRRVARLSIPRFFGGKRNGGGVGTGWLIAPRLLLTNYHVIAARDKREAPATPADFKLQGENTTAWFDYHDEGRHKGPVVGAMAVVAESAGLDYALLRLRDDAALRSRHRMDLTTERSLEQGARLNIIQCPGGGPLRFAIRNNFYVGKGERPHQLRYLTDTKTGSSGSPVLDDHWEVVAMHRGSKEVNPKSYKGEASKTGVVKFHNEGIAIHEIVDNLPAKEKQEIQKAQKH